jgi:dihydroorotase-like cyclic amidohydrolase
LALSMQRAINKPSVLQIIDTVFPNASESLLAAYDRWRSWADNKITCNYGLSVVVGAWSDRAKDEMVQLTKEKGVNSFVFHMGNKAQGYMLRDDALFQAFGHCKQIGALARVHAENGDVVQEVGEYNRTRINPQNAY